MLLAPRGAAHTARVPRAAGGVKPTTEGDLRWVSGPACWYCEAVSGEMCDSVRLLYLLTFLQWG